MATPPIIIIAETDPMIKSALRVEFTHLGFAVLLAASVSEAEDYASRAVAHLIVMDAGRRDIGAYESCARIRRRAGYANRPIVLTVNDPSDQIRAAAHKAGADAVLPKPYSIGDLFRAVRPHVPPDDLLLTARGERPDMAPPRQEWTLAPIGARSSANGSVLERNGQILTILRGNGVKIPLIRRL